MIFTNRIGIRFNIFLLLYSVFIFVTVISVFYALDIYLSFTKAITLISLFALIYSIYLYMTTNKSTEIIVKSIIFNGLFASLFILIYFDVSNPIRLGYQLGNVNDVGLLITIASILSISKGLMNNRKIYYVIFLINVIVVILTGSRKSLILLILSLFILLFIKNSKKMSKLIISIFILSVFIVILIYVINTVPTFYNIMGSRLASLLDGLFGSGTDEGSFNIRLTMIQVGIDLFNEKPFFGFGIDNYRILFSRLPFGYLTYSHSNFIELLVGVGILGTLSFYIAILYIVTRGIKNSSKLSLSNLSFLIIVIGYIILSPSLVYYDSKIFSIVLASLCSAVYSISNLK